MVLLFSKKDARRNRIDTNRRKYDNEFDVNKWVKIPEGRQPIDCQSQLNPT